MIQLLKPQHERVRPSHSRVIYSRRMLRWNGDEAVLLIHFTHTQQYIDTEKPQKSLTEVSSIHTHTATTTLKYTHIYIYVNARALRVRVCIVNASLYRDEKASRRSGDASMRLCYKIQQQKS